MSRAFFFRRSFYRVLGLSSVFALLSTACAPKSDLQDYMLATWETSYIKIVMLPEVDTLQAQIYEDDFSNPQSPRAQSTYHNDGSFEAWYLMPDGKKTGQTTGKWSCKKDSLYVSYSYNNRRIEAAYAVTRTPKGFQAVSIYDWNNNGVASDTLYMHALKL